MTVAQRTLAPLAFLASAGAPKPVALPAAGVRGTRAGWAVRFGVAVRATRSIARPA
ncbi:MAG: hypothetical protein ABEJ76_05870 [Halanaeroarchaeum sp.]